jgi:hypothetical protein
LNIANTQDKGRQKEKLKMQKRRECFPHFCIFNFSFCLLEWLSSGEACVYVMPPLQFVAFAELPAEQHDPTVAQRRKVYEAARVVFHLNAQGFQLARSVGQPDQYSNIFWAAGHTAAALFRALCGVSCSRLKGEQAVMLALYRLDYTPHAREQSIRLFHAEDFHRIGAGG